VGKRSIAIANTEERNPSEKAGGRQELTASSEEEKHPRELSNPGPDAEGVNTPKNTRETKDRPAQEAASSDSVAKSHNSPGFFGRAIGRGAGRAKNLLWG
jgi:hypothetical protein